MKQVRFTDEVTSSGGPPSHPIPIPSTSNIRHASDLFRMLPPVSALPHANQIPTPTPKTRKIHHANDLFQLLPPATLPPHPVPPTPPSVPQKEKIRHANDLFRFLPPAATPLLKIPSAIPIPLPAPSEETADIAQQHDVETAAATTSSSFPSSSKSAIMDTMDEDTDEKFVFNTNNILATRQETGSWRLREKDPEWILSREELHAEQVDLDRLLPAEMSRPFYPTYVSLLKCFSIPRI